MEYHERNCLRIYVLDGYVVFGITSNPNFLLLLKIILFKVDVKCVVAFLAGKFINLNLLIFQKP